MRRSILLVAWLLVFSQAAHGELTAVGEGGFAVRHSVTVQAAHARVFQTMVGDISAWWLKDHTWSGNAANLSIEQRAGGCFCEQLPEGGSVEHMRVIFIRPGSLVRLQGGLGPLQDMGLNGALSWKVSAVEGGGSRIEWSYNVHGFVEGGFKESATAVERVLGQQLASLAAELEQP